jgi:hypothetical protein
MERVIVIERIRVEFCRVDDVCSIGNDWHWECYQRWSQWKPRRRTEKQANWEYAREDARECRLMEYTARAVLEELA